MKLVYLCGPIAGLTYGEARNGWRKKFAAFMPPDVHCLSPMRAKDHIAGREGEHHVIGTGLNDYDYSALSTAKGITTRDRFDTQRASVVVANLEHGAPGRVSIGSMIELGWADAARVPVVAILTEGNVHWHPMVTELCGYIVPTVDEAARLTAAILREGV